MADPSIVEGKLVSDRVTDKISPKIEKGVLTKVNAILLHQTGGTKAESALSSYAKGKNGAHFLIDKDGTIYQTARVTQVCWHVGKVQSRCYALKTCTADELKNVKAILFKKGDSYSARVAALNKHEEDKAYPDRFPTNGDSIGIEIVSGYSESKGYEMATDKQNASVAWLVSTLQSLLTLGAKDVYRHPEVSYKKASEAQSVRP